MVVRMEHMSYSSSSPQDVVSKGDVGACCCC